MLSERKNQILEFISNYQQKEGYPPSVREICKALGFASPGSLLKHLRSLEVEGLIIAEPGKKRAWKLTNHPLSRSIPLIGRIAAGAPILADQNKEGDLAIDPRLSVQTKCLRSWFKVIQ